MDRLFETAYPQLKSDSTTKELDEIYTPTAEELALVAREAGHSAIHQLGFLLHLKLFQRLGYVTRLAEVPLSIRQHIARTASIVRTVTLRQLADYDRSGSQRRHLQVVRAHLSVRTLDDAARNWLERVAQQAALTKNAEADIINVLLEELVRERYELPGFTILQRMARRARDQVDQDYFEAIIAPLTTETRRLIDSLFIKPKGALHTTWQALKREPRKPTNREVRHYLQHVQRLNELVDQLPAVNVPVAKLRYFRQMARSQDAAQMSKLTAVRRYALAIIFIRSQFSKTLDDAGDLFIRLVHNMEKSAQQHLQEYLLNHARRTDDLIAQLKSILVACHEQESSVAALQAMMKVLPADMESTIAACNEHLAYSGNNFLPFMLKPYQNVRSLLFNCLDILEPRSTSTDKLTEKLITSLQLLRKSRLEILNVEWLKLNPDRDFNWLSDKWRRLVMVKGTDDVIRVHRKFFEIAALQHIKQELRSADLYIANSAQYDDYREQLVDQATFASELPHYGALAGIATEPPVFVQQLKIWLTDAAQRIDAAFPENSHAEIIQGRLVLRKPDMSPESQAIRQLDRLITQYLPDTNIVDVLTDTEKWLQLHQQFGPLSGSMGRMDDPQMRFITTLFCYGCNLGPTQTTRSVKGLSAKQVAWLNLKNVTEDRLDKAIVKVINAYNKFELPGYWGTGKHASVDGTKWNLYEQNLLSEYHIRYGGYGGIGYYLVSDKYIALFSHFIPCGVYEANYLFDGLMENESDIQPDTIHGDTQAQNYPVFGLSYLLGIQLMPRIRGIQHLNLFRPDRRIRYQHIDALFNETINWPLIETHLPDMLRVVISIKQGKITASTILRRLGTASRKNKLYFAFRELGKVVRTVFLLRYIEDVELRKTIHAATNKSEEYNGFTKWAFFGDEGMIAENIQHEQRKIVKYNHLVSNMVILHNVVQMTQVIKDLQAQGEAISPALLAGLSPYRTAHINRLGDYVVNLEKEVKPLDFNIRIIE